MLPRRHAFTHQLPCRCSLLQLSPSRRQVHSDRKERDSMWYLILLHSGASCDIVIRQQAHRREILAFGTAASTAPPAHLLNGSSCCVPTRLPLTYCPPFHFRILLQAQARCLWLGPQTNRRSWRRYPPQPGQTSAPPTSWARNSCTCRSRRCRRVSRLVAILF